MDRADATKPGLVVREPGVLDDAEDRHLEVLDQVTSVPFMERLKDIGHERELMYRAEEPVRRAIEKDEGAMRALREVSAARHQRLTVEARDLSDLFAGAVTGRPVLDLPGTSPPSFNVRQGVSVFGPPYDLDRPGPMGGAGTTATADRGAGRVSVSFGGAASGHRGASASVSLLLRPEVDGVLEVRGPIRYEYSWLVGGHWLSAHTEGRISVTAVRLDDAQLMDSRTVHLWSVTTKSDVHSGQDDGWVRYPYPSPNFPVDAGVRYVVSLTASVGGDQSDGTPPFSWSISNGSLSARWLYVAAELYT